MAVCRLRRMLVQLQVFGLAQIPGAQLQLGPGRAVRSPLAWSGRQQPLLGPARVAVARGEAECWGDSMCRKAPGAGRIRHPRAGLPARGRSGQQPTLVGVVILGSLWRRAAQKSLNRLPRGQGLRGAKGEALQSTRPGLQAPGHWSPLPRPATLLRTQGRVPQT